MPAKIRTNAIYCVRKPRLQQFAPAMPGLPASAGTPRGVGSRRRLQERPPGRGVPGTYRLLGGGPAAASRRRVPAAPGVPGRGDSAAGGGSAGGGGQRRRLLALGQHLLQQLSVLRRRSARGHRLAPGRPRRRAPPPAAAAAHGRRSRRQGAVPGGRGGTRSQAPPPLPAGAGAALGRSSEPGSHKTFLFFRGGAQNPTQQRPKGQGKEAAVGERDARTFLTTFFGAQSAGGLLHPAYPSKTFKTSPLSQTLSKPACYLRPPESPVSRSWGRSGGELSSSGTVQQEQQSWAKFEHTSRRRVLQTFGKKCSLEDVI